MRSEKSSPSWFTGGAGFIGSQRWSTTWVAGKPDGIIVVDDMGLGRDEDLVERSKTRRSPWITTTSPISRWCA